MSDANFVGSIPQHYDRHLGPVIFDPFARELAGRIDWRAGLRVVETACGTGVLTRRLLERLPAGGKLVATDLNGAMIAHARSRTTADARLEWREADGQALPFEDGAFDALACQFGLMFYPDRLLGLREARRVLRPGGQLAFSVWDSMQANAYGRLAHEAISAHFPVDPPRFYHTPFGWHDVADLRATAERAGFRGVDVQSVELEARSESSRSFAIGLVRGNPVWNAILERGGDPAAIEDDVERRLAQSLGRAPCVCPIRAHLVTGRA